MTSKKDLKQALKTKLKVASFIDKTTTEPEMRCPQHEKNRKKASSTDLGLEVLEFDWKMSMGGEVEDTDNSDDVAIVTEETNNPLLENMDLDVTEELEHEHVGISSSSIPDMRPCYNGISYRKLDCNSILVSIEPCRKLFFTGKLIIQVLKGVVDIYGFRVVADGRRFMAFSAKGHSSLLPIQSMGRKDSNNDVVFESHPKVSRDEILTTDGSLFILEGFENEWTEGLRHVYPESSRIIGPSITGIGPGKTPKKRMLMEKLGFDVVEDVKSKKFKLLEFPPYFDSIFSDLTNQFDCSNERICIFGGKGVGKSTFTRWLTNRFLSYQPKHNTNSPEVLFLDLDPGQTEFTPPGMISAVLCTEPVLGPNFTHLKNPTRSIFLGDTNVADFPVSYIRGVAALVEYCVRQEGQKLRNIPWVVNTMGFSQGLGVHLACEIIRIVRPRSVIQLNIANDKRSFPFLLNKENVTNHSTFLRRSLHKKYQKPLDDYVFLSVKSACNREETSNTNVWGASPKSLRDLVLTSYFSEKVGSADEFNLKSVVPLCVPLNSVAVGTVSSHLSYNEILDTINGNLVALCEMENSLFQATENSCKKFITQAGMFTNNCFGYGLIRAIDKQSEVLYLITPVQETDILTNVNVIISAGGIGIPVYLYVHKTQSNNDSEMPYVMNRKEGTSTLHTAAKKVFTPKRVTHKVLRNCLL